MITKYLFVSLAQRVVQPIRHSPHVANGFVSEYFENIMFLKKKLVS